MTTTEINIHDKHQKQKFRVSQLILGICLFLFTMFCLLPILLVVISAFTSEKEITSSGFTYFPKTFSMDGMNAVRVRAKLPQVAYSVDALRNERRAGIADTEAFARLAVDEDRARCRAIGDHIARDDAVLRNEIGRLRLIGRR